MVSDAMTNQSNPVMAMKNSAMKLAVVGKRKESAINIVQMHDEGEDVKEFQDFLMKKNEPSKSLPRGLINQQNSQ